jgi:hypothetical protein
VYELLTSIPPIIQIINCELCLGLPFVPGVYVTDEVVPDIVAHLLGDKALYGTEIISHDPHVTPASVRTSLTRSTGLRTLHRILLAILSL